MGLKNIQNKFAKDNWNYDQYYYTKYGSKVWGIVCPICKHLIMNYYHGEGKKIRTFNNFRRHLESKIRLSGDPKHVKLFIELYGKRQTIKKLNKWVEDHKIIIKKINKGIISNE